MAVLVKATCFKTPAAAPYVLDRRTAAAWRATACRESVARAVWSARVSMQVPHLARACSRPCMEARCVQVSCGERLGQVKFIPGVHTHLCMLRVPLCLSPSVNSGLQRLTASGALPQGIIFSYAMLEALPLEEMRKCLQSKPSVGSGDRLLSECLSEMGHGFTVPGRWAQPGMTQSPPENVLFDCAELSASMHQADPVWMPSTCGHR
mmetsp:Transcript_17385/g.52254  ORF Transcript_17385/g.52254 Transcript_17385/m.52254 type:complete len:207 (-) Transcript_17385:13-633(-)